MIFPDGLMPEQLEHLSRLVGDLEAKVSGDGGNKEEFLDRLRQGEGTVYLFTPCAEDGSLVVNLGSYSRLCLTIDSEEFPGKMAGKLHEIAKKHGVMTCIPPFVYDHLVSGNDPEPPRYFTIELDIFPENSKPLSIDELLMSMHSVSMAVKEARRFLQHYDIAAREGEQNTLS